MKDQEEIVLQLEDDALAQAAETQDLAVFALLYRRLDGPEQKRTREADLLKGLAYDPRLQGVDVEQDIGQFGHTASRCGTGGFETSP